MNTRASSDHAGHFTRRAFVKATAAVAALPIAGAAVYASPRPQAPRIRVGVIGCGGRGTGAALNALEASDLVEISALADVFPDRLASCRRELASENNPWRERVRLSDDACFIGFDGYEKMLAVDGLVDVVLLATPPHFRPMHLAAAVGAGKHVFMEKPVAIDPAGIRIVLDAAELATRRKLSIVAGTQRRHERCYLEAMSKLKDGAIGRIVSARCYWNQGGLWMHKRQPEWSDMEWQLRNWLYFTWLSGDHIVEQHVHNLDVINWAIGAPPIRATGMGGRQVRTSSDYGHVFDHFAVEYEYPGGVHVISMCRQIDGCASRVEEIIEGVNGTCITTSGQARITPASGSNAAAWSFSAGNNNPYVQEHIDLFRSITEGAPCNEARQVAEATMTAIMGRMSAYTGKSITWEQAMNSKLDLSPGAYEMGPLPMPEVAVPGRTPLI